ncbi:Glyoxylate/hydroxypyruvate reductase A HPR2 [Nymphon striatum]|nr:Glyoxylate/hydroxypyruvate reductase A HPR2 [Nymphon striatum]
MQKLQKTCVLIDHSGHEKTRLRIIETFNAIVVPSKEIAKLTNEQKQSIQAIASLFMPVDSALIDQLPNLEIISSFGVGNTLETEKNPFPLSPLSMQGRSVGIYGLGRIGQTIAKRLSGFDVSIHYHSRNEVKGANFTYHETLLSLATTVNTLIVIVPGTTQTRHAIDSKILSALGSQGVLINVGRGSVVDEKALISALQSGTIAAAGLDVFENEPDVPQALLDLPNACLFPHIASASRDTRTAMGDLVIDQSC